MKILRWPKEDESDLPRMTSIGRDHVFGYCGLWDEASSASHLPAPLPSETSYLGCRLSKDMEKYA